MNNYQLKIKKILNSFGIFTVLLGVNNNAYSEYLLKNGDTLEDQFLIKDKSSRAEILSSDFYQEKFIDTFLVNSFEETKSYSDANVLISEIVIEGWESHPEGRKLELAVYDAMSVKPGSIINSKILDNDLQAIFATGFLTSKPKFEAVDGPLGVKLIIKIDPLPILKKNNN